jgi:hypothetical protein
VEEKAKSIMTPNASRLESLDFDAWAEDMNGSKSAIVRMLVWPFKILVMLLSYWR